MHQLCFIGKNYQEEYDRTLFDEEDVLIPIEEDDKTIAHLLVKGKRMPSMKEAKRNGWATEIPMGWTHFTIGKGKKRTDVYIWNPSYTIEAVCGEREMHELK